MDLIGHLVIQTWNIIYHLIIYKAHFGILHPQGLVSIPKSLDISLSLMHNYYSNWSQISFDKVG